MTVRREEVEALPGFLGWHSLSTDEAPGTNSPGNAAATAIEYANAILGCSFAEKLTLQQESLVMDFLADSAPKDDSYLWDGSQKGWKLEASDDIRLSIGLGKPLGDLLSDQLDALRKILGDAQYNHLSAFQTEVLVSFKANRLEARQTRDALRSAGFDADPVERNSYQIVREFAGSRSALLIENEAEHERIVNRMIEAGVPVVRRVP